MLFGDGAGAVVLEASDRLAGIVASRLHADGRIRIFLCRAFRGGKFGRSTALKWMVRLCLSWPVHVLDQVAHEVLDAAGDP